MKKSAWHALVLGVLCAVTVSCSVLPDILVKPFETAPTTQKKQLLKKKQAKSCYPVRDKDVVYIVRKGDTLGEIAECFKTRWYYISSRNKLRNPSTTKHTQHLSLIHI